MIQLIKYSPISFHSYLSALLFYFCLIYASSWNLAFAQTGSAVNQAELAAVKAAKLDQTVGTGDDTGPRELSGFFMIGIAINAVVMLLFAAWFINEWKKQNKNRIRDKRE
ncbi:hypothetical protein ACFL17_01095 [Pseudomonadota bacterium]